MVLKRVGHLGSKRTRRCLRCASPLVRLKDNVVNECEYCGQKHLVDIYGTSLVLTVATRPDLRHREIVTYKDREQRKKAIECFKKELAAFRKKWEGSEEKC